MGRRRLELFGCNHNSRPGWLTIGWDLVRSNFVKSKYQSYFLDQNNHPDLVVPTTSRIEELRPRNMLAKDISAHQRPKN
jgi:hypothetical protein